MSLIELQPRNIHPQHPDGGRIVLASRFDIHEVDEFERSMEAAFVDHSSVLIDAREVKHIDRAGLDALLARGSTGPLDGRDVQLMPSLTILVATELVHGATIDEFVHVEIDLREAA